MEEVRSTHKVFVRTFGLGLFRSSFTLIVFLLLQNSEVLLHIRVLKRCYGFPGKPFPDLIYFFVYLKGQGLILYGVC